MQIVLHTPKILVTFFTRHRFNFYHSFFAENSDDLVLVIAFLPLSRCISGTHVLSIHIRAGAPQSQNHAAHFQIPTAHSVFQNTLGPAVAVQKTFQYETAGVYHDCDKDVRTAVPSVE